MVLKNVAIRKLINTLLQIQQPNKQTDNKKANLPKRSAEMASSPIDVP